MATASEVAAGDTHAFALTADCGDAVFVCEGVELADIDTGADLDRGAAVVRGLVGVLLDELEVLEVVRPDGQSTVANRLAEEVVASVPDDETHIGGAGEVDGELDLGDTGYVDGIGRVAADLAGRAAHVGILGQAGEALVQRRHGGSRIGLVDGVISPTSQDGLAFRVVIVVAVLIASSADGYRLDERATGQQVEDAPHRLARVLPVARVCLAAIGAALLRLVRLIGELE